MAVKVLSKQTLRMIYSILEKKLIKIFFTAEWIFFKAIKAVLGKVLSANISSKKQMIPDILVIIYQLWIKL